MKTFKLSLLYQLINIDGVKLAVDLKCYSIFIWNDYVDNSNSNLDVDYDSFWVVFENLTKEIFISFLQGEISFLSLFINQKYSYAYLKNDYDTIVIDKNFKFNVTLPDENSALIDETSSLVPVNDCSFGKLEYFNIHAVSFGKVQTNLSAKFSNVALTDNLSLLSNKFECAAFLKNLGELYPRILYDQVSFLLYNCASRLDSTNTIAQPSFFEWKQDIDSNRKCADIFYIYRTGNNFELYNGNGKDCITIKYNDFISFIDNLGDTLATIFIDTKWSDVAYLWKTRNKNIESHKLIFLSTGLDNKYQKSLSYIVNHEKDSLGNNFYADTHLRAVARLSHKFLSDNDVVSILEIAQHMMGDLRNVPTSNHCLDFIISNIPASVFSNRYKFYEQGYILAEYIRNFFQLNGKIESIINIYNKIGVKHSEEEFHPSVYALAMWYHKNIFILLNTNPSALGFNNNLIRITLAHELAHILVDKDESLPIAEVLLAHATKLPIEQRARAFAAEFLLPRRLAVEYADMNDFPNLNSLSQEYGVSEIVAARQIVNGARNQQKFNADWKRAASQYIKNNRESVF
jgi:Zn-dependent peptidase ImmA (M78 family)